MNKHLTADIFKNEKSVKVIFIIGIAFVVIIFLYSFIEPNEKREAFDAHVYTAQLESRLESIISEIDGVGRIKVMITLDNLDEDVYSKKETAVLTTKTPAVRGVVVVCEGGNGIIVKQKIVEAVSKVLGISTTRVCVTY